MWHGQHSLDRTVQPCYSQNHANDSHLTTSIIKGDSPIRYLLVKEKAEIRSESQSEFQFKVTFAMYYTSVLPSEKPSRSAFTYVVFIPSETNLGVFSPLLWFVSGGENKAITHGCRPNQAIRDCRSEVVSVQLQVQLVRQESIT